MKEENKKEFLKEKLTPPSKIVEKGEGIEKEIKKSPEKKNIPEEILLEHLRQEIELMEVDEKTAQEAEKKAEKIKFLGEKEKIEHLLGIASNRGVVFAVKVAQRMNDPYILDIFHDILAREGYYKQFFK